MLRRINGQADLSGACTDICSASFPVPFETGLEYSAPARGMWNIVHTGMLIPQSHQIFICAQGCLRGVVLTAAEMNAMDRFSSVAILEENLLDGTMEELIINGASDIIERLEQKPPAVLVFTSCIQHFSGCDLDMVYSSLRERFPDIDFTDCYMTPILRKSGLTPDQLMRKQLYSLLPKRSRRSGCVNIIGNNLPTDDSSELARMIRLAGCEIMDITRCKTYGEYLSMSESELNISYNPVAKLGGDELEMRLGQKHLYLPLCYGFDEIETNLSRLAQALNITMPDFSRERDAACKELKNAQDIIGDTPVSIDYTATMRPLGLARLLTEHGFNVETVYLDCFSAEEEQDFVWLQKNLPHMKICATVHAKMRLAPREHERKILAIGQKAAYFAGTDHFVNIVEGGGMYGFDGIARLARLMVDAFENKKDTRALIQIKGLGCGCV